MSPKQPIGGEVPLPGEVVFNRCPKCSELLKGHTKNNCLPWEEEREAKELPTYYKHEMSEHCWCEPTIHHVEGCAGRVIVHRAVQ